MGCEDLPLAGLSDFNTININEMLIFCMMSLIFRLLNFLLSPLPLLFVKLLLRKMKGNLQRTLEPGTFFDIPLSMTE